MLSLKNIGLLEKKVSDLNSEWIIPRDLSQLSKCNMLRLKKNKKIAISFSTKFLSHFLKWV